ncbi:TetR/AcrR family transcriptional regulator [Kibdelosporangium aridum]|nr:TetR/AcrR family transcriptional regulator [Kibdelosporangium aridum]
MSSMARRERERAERHQLIIATARQLAETEGWDAVTTRRLADAIEYSQPVLYSHFDGKEAIVAAVALEGFAEMANAIGKAKDVAQMVRIYLSFAEDNPAVYDAMFTMNTRLRFAEEDTPEPMKAGFRAIQDVLKPVAKGRDLGIFTELAWSALHGLVTLTRGGRLPAEGQRERIAMLVDQLVA